MRIEFLEVQNFILVKRARLDLSGGFNVLTGETGAGKTMLLSALGALLGARADWEVMGKSDALVRAVFQDGRKKIAVSRDLSGRTRKSRAWVDEKPVTATELASFPGPLVAIHGQHENQRILNPDNHLLYLDSLGGLSPEREQFALSWEKKEALSADLARRKRELEALQEARDLYLFQLNELTEAGLQEGEEETLRDRRRLLAAGADLAEAVRASLESLYDGEGSAHERMAGALDALGRFGDITPVAEAREAVAESSARLDDARRALARLAESLEYDPDDLERINQRLFVISRLREKYSQDVPGLLRMVEELKLKLGRVDTGDEEIAGLEARLAELCDQVNAMGQALSEKRAAAAVALSARVEEELSSLSMAGARFHADVWRDTPSDRGFDRCEFRFSANPGQPLLPLVKVASGGELSRVMLALETALADAEDTPVLVFDEVDQGIGGRVAETVGRKLRDLAQAHQVLTVTHLPQIAARAETHFLVEKKAGAVSIRRLDQDERVSEIARMAAGEKVTEEAMSLARRLLQG